MLLRAPRIPSLRLGSSSICVTRGRHAAEGRASGYVVASRDAKAPDLHFGSDERDFGKRPEKSEGAPAGPGERTAQRPAADRGEDAALRRRREALLRSD